MKAALIITLAGLMVSTSCPRTEKTIPRRVVIFADTTTSLQQEERDKVAELTASYVANLPSDTSFWIYPITADMAKAQLIYANTVPAEAKTTSSKKSLNVWREDLRKGLRQEIAKLSVGLNTPEHVQMRSCIFGAFDVAKRQIDSVDPTPGNPANIVLISDMLEECEDTPLQRRIDISQPDLLEREIEALASETGTYPDLRGFRVMAVIPTALVSQPSINGEPRPSMKRVRAYWTNALAKSNVAAGDFWLDSDDRAKSLATWLER